jgi:hypothetical protein
LITIEKKLFLADLIGAAEDAIEAVKVAQKLLGINV